MVGVKILERTKIPMNTDLSVHDVEKVSMACRVYDYYLWISLNLLKQVLVADGKNFKGGGFDSPWGEVCEKTPSVRPCSHSSNHNNGQDAVCLTVCTFYICTQKSCQDGVGIGISWGNYKKSGIHGFG